VFHEAKAR